MAQLQCPKCYGILEAVVYADVEVDRCTKCKGIWFDAQEAHRLRKIQGSESIDTGDPKLGTQLNNIRNISCPKCSIGMTKMASLKRPYIRYEKCLTCYGLWFDSGEFKDYKEEGILEILIDIF